MSISFITTLVLLVFTINEAFSFLKCLLTKWCLNSYLNLTTWHWNAEDLFINDDASSQSSLNSFKYSNLSYYSANEDDYDSSISRVGEPTCNAKAPTCTRFCPTDMMSANHFKQYCELQFDYKRNYGSKLPQKLTRNRSLVDARSELLRRAVTEEINKRRLFKTVGAVENIGFQDPGKL